MRRIYLDNAATSWPKPDAVYAAVDTYLRENGAPAGRSGYAEAAEASRLIEAARRDLARVLGVRQSERLIFCSNGTDALNLALHGFLRPADHVITTCVEHNSTLRPLRKLEETGTIEVTRVGVDSHGIVDVDQVRNAFTPKTRLVAVSHASNVTGAIQPVEAIRDLAHERNVRILVDAAQTAGHLPLELDTWGIDIVATSGHKGLLGPLGTGLLYLAPGVDSEVESIRQGGTGTRSEDDRQPLQLPQKYESGNHNVPGIVGQGAAAGYLFARTLSAVREHDLQLTTALLSGFLEIPGVTIMGPPSPEARVGLVSICIDGYDPQEAAAALDAAYRIQVRPGLHCAPLMHRALRTLVSGGTIRFSLGQFNTVEDVAKTIAAVAELAASSL